MRIARAPRAPRDPRDIWLSEHFRLSDLLGNSSVYTRGYSNVFDGDAKKLANARALCENALEQIVERFGPISISYGYISPEFSTRTVRYQDPDKPSHHRWDLGAAVDIIPHRWVRGLPAKPAVAQLFADENTRTSPALFAHEVSDMGVPYSRMITYSESPCICIAVSADEVANGAIRRAFYENRFTGPGKPAYLQLPSEAARKKVHSRLQSDGLPLDWRGAGYPTKHGGGIRQLQHIQVSEYTTALDWAFNLKSISNGIKNIPSMSSEHTQDALAAAGIVYDRVVDALQTPRLSILRGFTAVAHPDFSDEADWRGGEISFELGARQGQKPQDFTEEVAATLSDGEWAETSQRGAVIHLEIEGVLHGYRLE